ncbi:host-nuclease inhibitor Gam family protein [Salinisphaera orenii]|uniref:host-nuclease inhibitor Gam family protein n=1 Tax=Salinisphaera orenii TaxID=856731 RepID=UPI000DBE55A7
MSLSDVEKHTQAYAAKRDTLSARVAAMSDEIEAIKRRKLPGIKKAVAAAADARSALEAAIEANRESFAKPKTLIIAGVRVGLAKGKGRIVFDDERLVLDRIYRQFPQQSAELIKVTEKPVRSALERLSTADLKRLGCSVEDTDDQIVIKPTDGETDKIVSALLAEAEKLEAA